MVSFQVHICGRNLLLKDKSSPRRFMVSSKIDLVAATAEEARAKALHDFQRHPDLDERILNSSDDPPLIYASVAELPEASLTEIKFSPLQIEPEPDLGLIADFSSLLDET